MADFDLDKVIIDFSDENIEAAWTVRDAVEGLQIFGGIGSGKTSGPGRYFALKYLSNGFGGLVLAAKHDEKELWQKYCHESGRSDDLIIVEPGGKHCFNFLEYESDRASSKRALTANIVQLLKTVIRARKEKSTGGREDQFWENSLDLLLANTINLCQIAFDKVDLQLLYDICLSAPRKHDTQGDGSLPKKSEYGNLRPVMPSNKPATKAQIPLSVYNKAYDVAMRRVTIQTDNFRSKLTEHEISKLKTREDFTLLAYRALPEVRQMGFVSSFFNKIFLSVADRTRSIIDFLLVSFLYNLLQEPVYSLFGGNQSTFTPEDSLKGKIILINLPVKDYNEVGQDTQILFKYIWQRAMEKRRIEENGRPVFLWADESQTFLHEHDADFQATARSSRIATVYLSQNLPNYFANMGGQVSHHKVKSFLGTLATKIFLANADLETNKYASDLVGQAFFKKDQHSRTVAGEFSATASHSYNLEPIMRPEEFVGFRTGSSINKNMVDALIHTQGKQIVKEGNFKKISFDQNFSLKNR